MPVDTRGYRAARTLQDAVSDLDTNAALGELLGRSPSRNRHFPALVLATLVVLVVLGVATVTLRTQDPSSSDAAAASSSATVGAHLPLPKVASARVPDGWAVVRDGRVVELAPQEGGDARISMVIPKRVYQPPEYAVDRLSEDPVVWTVAHPDLDVTGERVDYNWTGADMKLSVAETSSRATVPLVPLPGGGPEAPALSVSRGDHTFVVDYVAVPDSLPILAAFTSPDADDAALAEAREQFLATLTLGP